MTIKGLFFLYNYKNKKNIIKGLTNINSFVILDLSNEREVKKMLFNTSLAIALALQIKTEIKNVIPKVDDVYYISEEGSINENVPTDECFATVVKQGNKSYLSSEIDLKKEYNLHKGDHAIVILNDVGEIVDVINFGE